MSEWKPGDTVTFTLTGTIAHVNDCLATIDVNGYPHTVHVSHILGTPEQAKRERIIAQLSREFPDFEFEPKPDSESNIIIMAHHYLKFDDENVEQIRARVEELQAKQ